MNDGEPTIEQLITSGDVRGLEQRLLARPGDARVLLDGVLPLHFVCNRVFEGHLTPDQGEQMADALLASAMDPNARHGPDTLLISAVSLCCPGIALKLIDSGADIHGAGLFGARAVHWAAMLGFPIVVERLLREGAAVDQRDERYASPPLGWAFEGWKNGTNGGTREQPACVAMLVAAGAAFDREDAAALFVGSEHEAMRQALGL